MVGVDIVPELLAEARTGAAAFANVTFFEGDVTALRFADASFDVAASTRTLHHVERPDLAVTELTRVTRPRGAVLVVDQLAPCDPTVAREREHFERARDPSHARSLTDLEIRQLLEANGLALRRAEVVEERRDLEEYLALAGCSGEARERARALAPPSDHYAVELGWYLAVKPRGAA